MPAQSSSKRSRNILNPAQTDFIKSAQAALRGEVEDARPDSTNAGVAAGRQVAQANARSLSVSPTRRVAAPLPPQNQEGATAPDRAGQFTDVSGYLHDVGDVFKGYGDVLNPANALHGAQQLYQMGRAHGAAAAAAALGKGTWHGLTDWTTTDDPRRFGSSFGTALMAVAPGLKRIPNPTNIALEGPWLTPKGTPFNGKPVTGSTLIKVSRANKELGRVDIGRLPVNKNIPVKLQNRMMLHYHRSVPDPAKPGESLEYQGIGRHRPWQDNNGTRW